MKKYIVKLYNFIYLQTENFSENNEQISDLYKEISDDYIVNTYKYVNRDAV